MFVAVVNVFQRLQDSSDEVIVEELSSYLFRSTPKRNEPADCHFLRLPRGPTSSREQRDSLSETLRLLSQVGERMQRALRSRQVALPPVENADHETPLPPAAHNFSLSQP